MTVKLSLKVAMTAMTGKGTEKAREPFAKLVVGAVKQVEENGEIDQDHIKIEKKDGATIDDSALVQGVIIDKERVHPGMPSKVEDAKIALLNSAIEVKETEVDARNTNHRPYQKCKPSLNKKNA